MATNHEMDILIVRNIVKSSVPLEAVNDSTVKSKESLSSKQQKSLSNGIRPRRAQFHTSISDKIPARLILYFLSWSGFLVSFMMRNDINFALVAMTRDSGYDNEKILNETLGNDCRVYMQPKGNRTNSVSDIAALLNTTATTISAELLAESLVSQAITVRNISQLQHNSMDVLEIGPKCNNDVFNWSSTVRSVIISSFYWCYVLSQVVGGIATQHFGTKSVFGWSQFATAACSLCIPFCADIHYTAVIMLRSIQGFASGLTWPAMYAIVGHWIPLVERSRFMSSFQGFSIGIGLTYPLCGFLIDNFGWRYVFYTTGIFGVLWSLVWYLLAFNTPQEHPRITASELAYIEQNISGDMVGTQRMKVPWRSIFHSSATWAIAITTFGRIWIHYIFIIGGPSFMKNILKFDYEANGFLSGMPFVCSYFSSVIFCYIADQITMRQWLSLTNVRKLFTALSQIAPGLLIYWIGYIESSIVELLIVWFIAVTFITASYAGAMANIVDIAPSLAGPVLAFCQTIHMSASFLSPLVAGWLVTDESSIEQWRRVFSVSTVVTILTYLVYQVYATSEIQEWNYPPAALCNSTVNVTLAATPTPIPANILSGIEIVTDPLSGDYVDNGANSVVSSDVADSKAV